MKNATAIAWDQNSYLFKMIGACEHDHIQHWASIKPLAEREFRALLMMIEWAGKMKASGEFDLEQARIHIALQKSLMYLRFQELSGLPDDEAATVVNHAISSVRKELHEVIEWVII